MMRWCSTVIDHDRTRDSDNIIKTNLSQARRSQHGGGSNDGVWPVGCAERKDGWPMMTPATSPSNSEGCGRSYPVLTLPSKAVGYLGEHEKL